jgi:hypothetical protein
MARSPIVLGVRLTHLVGDVDRSGNQSSSLNVSAIVCCSAITAWVSEWKSKPKSLRERATSSTLGGTGRGAKGLSGTRHVLRRFGIHVACCVEHQVDHPRMRFAKRLRCEEEFVVGDAAATA